MHFLYLVSQASASGKQRARYRIEPTAELIVQVKAQIEEGERRTTCRCAQVSPGQMSSPSSP